MRLVVRSSLNLCLD
uniref:Uncharacterized protein n=1 Tax=Lepeophtheirus salmonis TaxID=72036 RepID=A0A0K2TWA0_LEPSM